MGIRRVASEIPGAGMNILEIQARNAKMDVDWSRLEINIAVDLFTSTLSEWWDKSLVKTPSDETVKNLSEYSVKAAHVLVETLRGEHD